MKEFLILYLTIEIYFLYYFPVKSYSSFITNSSVQRSVQRCTNVVHTFSIRHMFKVVFKVVFNVVYYVVHTLYFTYVTCSKQCSTLYIRCSLCSNQCSTLYNVVQPRRRRRPLKVHVTFDPTCLVLTRAEPMLTGGLDPYILTPGNQGPM